MPPLKYKPLAIGATPTLGTSGDAVKALQIQYNKNNPTATPLKADGLYGPLTNAALAPKVVAPDDPSNMYRTDVANTLNTNYTGYKTNTNPVGSTTGLRADYDALGNEIKTAVDTSSVTKASEAATKLINDRITALDQRRSEEIASIKADYEMAKGAQETRQNKDYQGQATNLITAGGGFLGYTGSQGGVLQNLKGTFEAEKTALMGKRDSAIQAAQSAYDDKQFALAQSLTKEAKDTEQEIYNRQKDFTAESLSLAREARASDEYSRKFADDKVKAYSILSDSDFDKLTPKQISDVDLYFGEGYTKSYRETAKQIAEGKTIENDLDFKNKVQTLINKTPKGQKITLADGTVYIGNKKPISIGGSSTAKGVITPLITQQIPALAPLVGQKEDDVILTLELSKPAPWFENYVKSTEPNKQFSQEGMKSIWDGFRNDPDLLAYRNTVKLNQRASVNDPLANLNISSEDIAAALNEE